MLWLCAAAVACLSHTDCFCLVVPVCSCRQAWLGAFLAAFAQASVWVLPFLGVSAQEWTAWAVEWEPGEDGALLCNNSVDVPCFRSSCVALTQDCLQNLYLVGNTPWLSGASCTYSSGQNWLGSRLLLSCSSGKLSLRGSFFAKLTLFSAVFQVCSLSI